MSYVVFKAKIDEIVRKAGGGVSVRFSCNRENGVHYANFSDGMVIIGNSTSNKVTVRWNGRNHQSMVAI